MANLVSGTGSLRQAGPGTLTVSAANTYAGGTTVAVLDKLAAAGLLASSA